MSATPHEALEQERRRQKQQEAVEMFLGRMVPKTGPQKRSALDAALAEVVSHAETQEPS